MKFKLRLRNIAMITLAGIINAFGITMFLMPVSLYDSGISGTAMLLAQLTSSQISLFLILLNIPLLLLGLKKQGLSFTVYAIYAVGVYSTFALLFNNSTQLISPLAGNDLLLCALFGGIISGVGSGITIRYGGAMDGIEVLAVIFAKRLGITVGTFIMVYNVILYIICGIIIKSWILPLYSIITYAAALKTIDFIVDGLDRAKCAIIITEHPRDICDKLCDTFGSGVTYLDAKGGYSNKEKFMIYFIVNRYQVVHLKEMVHEIDPSAYITISEVADVYSKNNK